MNLLIMFMISLMIALMMIIFNSMFTKKINSDREKKLPFECGFSNIPDSKSSFSINYFIILLIFIMFDIEIIFLMPIVTSMMNSYSTLSMKFILITSTFAWILFMSIIIEWSESSIEWIK